MDIKRVIKKVAIMTFMIFTISSVTDNTFAYWTTNVLGPADGTTTGTVLVGTWTTVSPYDPNTSYNIGDLVENNGITYEAKKSGLLKEPGVETGWKSEWTQL
ncbi:hypothetical protein [Candidatus Xianfuyuplasma coldseepsis]|uniref:Chitinase n=1 Tax=Candidatus Xianfuyuplasma coldseepsis TaxID=2782163 RepID=A0A7L7KPX3_9MOLU|nr:hypothetical protein [Xianfuyuplasma coldseepsis]QMS84625.1 hypothetical protein G4Z02_02290 [Xianfuyuplasma coldseepsis]